MCYIVLLSVIFNFMLCPILGHLPVFSILEKLVVWPFSGWLLSYHIDFRFHSVMCLAMEFIAHVFLVIIVLIWSVLFVS